MGRPFRVGRESMPCSWKRTWSEQEGRFEGAGGCGSSRFCREFDSRHMGNWQISIPSTVAVAGGGVQSITPRPNPDSPGALGHGIQSLTSGSVAIGGVREALARIYTRTSTFDKRSSIKSSHQGPCASCASGRGKYQWCLVEMGAGSIRA